MFAEFLLPDMVLFGEFANPKIQCKHAYTFKDEELVIHQSVLRKVQGIAQNGKHDPYDAAYEEYLSMLEHEGSETERRNKYYREDGEEESESEYEEEAYDDEDEENYHGFS
jgi:hypothetical protein